MSQLSVETTPSSISIKEIPSSNVSSREVNLSQVFFKYLFQSEEESDNILQEERKLGSTTVVEDISFQFQKPYTIQKEIEFELITPSKTKKIAQFYKCDYDNCVKSYRSRENLNLHIQNVHKKLKPYKCSYCNIRFSHRNGRIYHERRIHTKILPYKCTYDNCEQFFPCKSAMIAHIKSVHLHIKREKKRER